jgi:FtsH-binding integral membrane protein
MNEKTKNLIGQFILMGTGVIILTIVVNLWLVIGICFMILGNNINLENIFQEKTKEK